MTKPSSEPRKTQAPTANGAAKQSRGDRKAAGATRQPAAPDLDRRTLAEKYMPYVRSIAGKIKKTVAKEIDFEDLVEYGMIGLFEAADRYDPEHGANFMTFAYYRIRGAIYDGLRGMGWMSRAQYAKARFEEHANEYLAEVAAAQEAGEAPPASPFENAVQDLASAVQGLAAVYITTIDGTEGLQIADQQTPPLEESLGLEQARRLVRETVRKLPDQERDLLEMYYYKEMSLQDVGAKLGLSKSWTSRLHARVIEKLHRLLEDSFS
jgi:RNA polymerase sigma factor for flagellar operon FliA